MPLDHSTATAIVSVKGLALGCYNRRTTNWEVGFIRAPGHKLTVTVIKQTPAGPATTFFELDNQHRIFVSAENVLSPPDPFYKPMANFDRTATAATAGDFDLEDLRWLVDFENELNGGQPVTLVKPTNDVTPLFVSQPVLYAAREHRIDNKQAKLIRQSDRSEVKPFPQLSVAGKSDITCQEGGAVVLRVDGPLGFAFHLPQVPGGPPHEIKFENDCPPPLGTVAGAPSDFTLYYDLIADTSGDKFDISLPNGQHGEGAVCNKGFLGVRDELFPLPS